MKLNSIFFFIIPLLVSVGFYQNVNADNENIVGYDYFDNFISFNGTHEQRVLQSHHPYVLDNGNYVPYVIDGLTVNSHLGTVKLNSDGSYTWGTKFTDSIIAKYADISDLTTWTYPNTLNNDVPDVSFSNDMFISSKIKSGIGQLDYKYIFDNGKWKTQLEATNLSSLTTKVFGFDQIIDLNSDTIKFGGVTRNLDNFDGVTFDKEFLVNNEGKVLDLLNGVNFDFDLGFENLYSVTVYDTGINSSRLVFDYRTSEILMPNETLVIDPTFTDVATSGRVFSNTQVGTSCNATANTRAAGVTLQGLGDSDLDANCSVSWFEFDISSGDPSWTVTGVTLEYDVVSVTIPRDCTWREITVQPSTGSIQTIYDDARTDGTLLGAVDSSCTTVADGKIFTFDSTGIASVQTAIDGAQAWYGVGGFFDDQTRSSTNTVIIDYRETDAVLSITYSTIPLPDSITDLTLDSVGTTTASLSFTAPNLNGESLINYMLNVTTPQQSTPPSTFWMNASSSPFSVTGLSLGTGYSASASAYTAGGGNWTLANVLNFTTSAQNTPDLVDDLTGSSNISLSTITLTWSQPGSGSAPITGYQINYTTPIGDPQSIIENDTGTTAVTYQVINLQIGEPYSFRVAPWNSFGNNASGNIWNGTIETDYTIGNFSSPDVTNTNDFKIFFERTDINSTSLFLNVTYPNTYDLECNMYYAFARTNNTYGNLSSTVVDADDVESSFQFINATGDIITVNCTDVTTGDTSQYILTITQFPFLDQMDNIRNGTYGTYFKIGAIDGITLVVVFLGMIGLNRTTPIAGIMFVIIATLALSWFGIITYPIIMYPALALLAVWAFMSTRKDE